MAEMTALKAFRIIATEYKDIEDKEVKQYIEFTRPMVSRKRYGALYSRALALLAAHYMKMNGIQGTGGSELSQISGAASFGIASYTEGSTSISFSNTSATPGNSDSTYESTIYGTQYLSLRRMLPSIICGGENG